MDRKALNSAKLLKEKPGHGVQLLCGLKQKATTHTLRALLVNLHLARIDTEPRSQLLLGQPAERPSDCNAFSDFSRQIAVESGQ